LSPEDKAAKPSRSPLIRIDGPSDSGSAIGISQNPSAGRFSGRLFFARSAARRACVMMFAAMLCNPANAKDNEASVRYFRCPERSRVGYHSDTRRRYPRVPACLPSHAPAGFGLASNPVCRPVSVVLAPQIEHPFPLP
jgi:hypothetical protein